MSDPEECLSTDSGEEEASDNDREVVLSKLRASLAADSFGAEEVTSGDDDERHVDLSVDEEDIFTVERIIQRHANYRNNQASNPVPPLGGNPVRPGANPVHGYRTTADQVEETTPPALAVSGDDATFLAQALLVVEHVTADSAVPMDGDVNELQENLQDLKRRHQRLIRGVSAFLGLLVLLGAFVAIVVTRQSEPGIQKTQGNDDSETSAQPSNHERTDSLPPAPSPAPLLPTTETLVPTFTPSPFELVATEPTTDRAQLLALTDSMAIGLSKVAANGTTTPIWTLTSWNHTSFSIGTTSNPVEFEEGASDEVNVVAMALSRQENRLFIVFNERIHDSPTEEEGDLAGSWSLSIYDPQGRGGAVVNKYFSDRRIYSVETNYFGDILVLLTEWQEDSAELEVFAEVRPYDYRTFLRLNTTSIPSLTRDAVVRITEDGDRMFVSTVKSTVFEFALDFRYDMDDVSTSPTVQFSLEPLNVLVSALSTTIVQSIVVGRSGRMLIVEEGVRQVAVYRFGHSHQVVSEPSFEYGTGGEGVFHTAVVSVSVGEDYVAIAAEYHDGIFRIGGGEGTKLQRVHIFGVRTMARPGSFKKNTS